MLSEEQLNDVIDRDSTVTQWIEVFCPDGGQMRVRGSKGILPNTVPHDAFPRGIFEPFNKKKHEKFAWPPFSRLNLYREMPSLRFSVEDRLFDLSDHIGGWGVAYIGVQTIAIDWREWTEQRLKTIEGLIRDDLEFDGFKVNIERITTEESLPCEQEFLWRLEIEIDYGEEESGVVDNCVANSRRAVDAMFPMLAKSDHGSVPSIEIDVDNVPAEFANGKWECAIRELTAKWVSENSYSGHGTIWSYGAPSANFDRQGYSAFYAVIGMPKSFRKYLASNLEERLKSSVLGYSDELLPLRSEGWRARCQVQDLTVWEPLDEATWLAVSVP